MRFPCTTDPAGRSAAQRALLALLALLGGVHVPRASAQSQPPVADDSAVVRVEAIVTAVSGGSLYLDRGRNALLEPGDLVAIRPLGSAPVPAIIRSVSRTSSRAELPAGVTGVGIGDRAEVLIPQARVLAAAGVPGAGAAGAGEVPEHPPWTADAQGFDSSQPLLAPAWNKPADEQPMKVYGRFFTQWNGTWDSEYGNDYYYLRTGTELTIENPYGSGGEIHILGDLSRRDTILSDAPDQNDTYERLDRASYLWGGTREEADRVEVGRFLQHAFPELGVLDGAELAHRTGSGTVYGGSFGAMPEQFPSMHTGQDLQAAVFYRTDPSRDAPVEYGIAYQNTWHLGEQDRNLFVGTYDARVSEDVSVSADTLVDYYGPGDSLKNEGLQITEARVNGTWRVDADTGLGLHASHVRWPELKRDEFGEVSPDQVRNGQVTRVGANGWQLLSEQLRVDGRADVWQDQDEAGGSGNVRAALRNVAWDRGEVAVDLFVTTGEYTDGQGLRLSANRAFESIGFGTLSWEVSQYTNDTIGDESTDLAQQALRASLDSALGDGWSMSLYAEERFGDSQASHTLGLFLQRRF